MSQFNLDPNQKITKGKSSPINREFSGLETQGGKGINTNMQDINWTPSKLMSVAALLIIPYIGIILACFIAKMNFVGYFLIGIAIFVGLLFILLRLIDRQNF